jgi:hypothetical protein
MHEVAASHVAMISQQDAAANLVKRAALTTWRWWT